MSYEIAYLKTIEKLANNIDCDLTDLDDYTEDVIRDISKRFRKPFPQVRDDTIKAARDARRSDKEDDKLRYGHLDEYGEPK